MQNTENRKPENKKAENRKPRFEKRPAKVDDGLDKKLVEVNRVTKVVKGGRTMRFAALVVVGDRHGKIGMGTGKAAEVPSAIEKATQAAKKNMITVALDGQTIPHDIIGRYGKSSVKLLPSTEGSGVIAGGSVRPVVELCGIKDITAKVYGSRSKINCVRATFDGLSKLQTAETIAKLRGKTVEEIR